MPSFMTSPRLRTLKWILIIAVSSTLLLILAGSLLSYYASQQLEKRLKLIGGTFDALNINLISQQITIHQLKFHLPGDSVHPVPTTGQIKNITFKKVNFYQALVKKKLRIKEVTVSDANISVNQKTALTDSASGKIDLESIFVDLFTVKNLTMTVVDDSLMRYSGTLNLAIDNIKSSDTSDVANFKAYSLKDIEAKVTKLIIHESTGLYQTKISTVDFNTSDQNLQIDSIFLIPKYSKYKFAKAAGKQIDRINTFIRRVEINGLHFDQFRDSAFVASDINIIAAEVSSFRDKRMPFKQKENKPLPMEALKGLNFSIEVDTIRLRDSKITYEEFPTDGFKSGKVIFENLQATLTNLSNRTYQNKPAYATLRASASLMGKGQIQASFFLPIEDKTPYHAEGKISKMSLHHLNPVLENLAFISIESGRLNEINFNFDYSDNDSNGELTINYQDLKINGLKKEKSVVINDVKTFLINTVVKNDKDKGIPTEKRTGTIAFERDKKRQIFNYWWKSLLSGIKASVLN